MESCINVMKRRGGETPPQNVRIGIKVWNVTTDCARAWDSGTVLNMGILDLFGMSEC